MKNTQTFAVKGMHCASCAVIIEKTIKKIDGVEEISVNNGTENVKISFDETKTNPESFNKKLEPLGYSIVVPITAKEMGMTGDEHAKHLGVNQSKKEKLAEIKKMKTKLISAIPLAIVSVFVMGWDIFSQLGVISEMPLFLVDFFRYLLPIMATYSLVVSAFGTTLLKSLPNVFHTYFDVTIIVITFITLGKYLEARSKIKTGDAIEKLLNLQAKTAIIIRKGKEFEVPISDVKHEDVIIIKPGAKIPVDGEIIEGSSYIDESMVTGEPMSTQKKVGSSVVAGTINTSGSFTFKATKVGSETLLAQIIKMVEEAQGSKAPIQALADKISAVFVPIVLVISFLTLGLWLLIGNSYMGFSQALSFGLVSFVSILVIACPCALGLATPTAIIVGVGKGAKEGILIKDAATLEKLHKVDTVIVDKTGTITIGTPTLTDIKNLSDLEDKELISILASLEKKSEHPIAHAIVHYAQKKKIQTENVSDFKSLQGKGLKGSIKDTEYFVGNTKLIEELNIIFNKSKIEKLRFGT